MAENRQSAIMRHAFEAVMEAEAAADNGSPALARLRARDAMWLQQPDIQKQLREFHRGRP